MLLSKEVDCVLNHSGDVDTSTCVAEAGTIVNCPQTMGSVGGRRCNGVARLQVFHVGQTRDLRRGLEEAGQLQGDR